MESFVRVYNNKMSFFQDIFSSIKKKGRFINIYQLQIVEPDDSDYRQHTNYSQNQMKNLSDNSTDLILLLHHFHQQQHDLLQILEVNTLFDDFPNQQHKWIVDDG